MSFDSVATFPGYCWVGYRIQNASLALLCSPLIIDETADVHPSDRVFVEKINAM